MSNVADAREKFEKLSSKWPKPPQSDNQVEEPRQEAQDPPKETEQDQGQEDNAVPKTASDREKSIINQLMSKIDFSQLLSQDWMEIDVPVRDGLTIRLRSPTGDESFKYAAYLNRIKSGAENAGIEFTAADEYNYRIFWQLARGLVSINGALYMAHIPKDSKVDSIDIKIQNLRSKSKHIVEVYMWGQTMFDIALTRVCNGGPEFQEAAKNS